MQSRRWSLAEALTNTLVGFLISLAAQLVIFHFHGIKLSLGDNVAITLWFTLISIIRSYALRRVFARIKR